MNREIKSKKQMRKLSCGAYLVNESRLCVCSINASCVYDPQIFYCSSLPEPLGAKNM